MWPQGSPMQLTCRNLCHAPRRLSMPPPLRGPRAASTPQCGTAVPPQCPGTGLRAQPRGSRRSTTQVRRAGNRDSGAPGEASATSLTLRHPRQPRAHFLLTPDVMVSTPAKNTLKHNANPESISTLYLLWVEQAVNVITS
ncbi:hypothetical protein NDU88_008810 [Pleurodeles waltl]|uniref:Uncharacterized protein n=1 Tax=Pleurodeles waltl TaxID=8319 RepID=A0AAV7P1Z4_PLEWA|nr:hypothetical protein NDU88_008810 [Pleurodeles waltl]